jgi:DNA-binding transcriptional regulator GbsR (MarR family)
MRKRNREIKGVLGTSRMSYREAKESGQIARETDYVYSLLKEIARPMNSREIAERSGIERTNITRVLYDLIEINLVKVSHTGKCHYSKRTVNFYVCND